MSDDKFRIEASEADRPKRPYVKPAYESSAIFETLALACGKISATQAQCHYNPKVS